MNGLPRVDELIRRAFRFVIVGGITTLVAYAVVMLLLNAGLHYSLAIAGSWPPSVLVGFALNRRFTFEVKGAEKRYRDLGAFITGSLLQLGLAIVGFGVLTKQIGLAATPAFLLNLVITTALSFLFTSFVVFRRTWR